MIYRKSKGFTTQNLCRKNDKNI